MNKITCGVFVMRKQPQLSFLLLIKRKNNQYDIPKGKMESGESEISCALRELKQETQIKVEVIDLDMGFRYTQTYIDTEDNEVEKTFVIFLGWLKHEVKIKLSKEHNNYDWKPWNPPHDIQKKLINPLLVQLNSYLKNHPKYKHL
jgi:8-oxo-dGTP pyrophosphatase MutT (NUDIX family)